DFRADRKIFIAMEPDAISHVARRVEEVYARFDAVLTFDERLLATVPNAVLFEFGSTWLAPGEPVPAKRFAVSTVVGHKRLTDGHRLRHVLWEAQDRIRIPRAFYASRHGGVGRRRDTRVLGSSKRPLFESMFHICIENVSQPYYFSEKLVDALLTETVPIYWG